MSLHSILNLIILHILVYNHTEWYAWIEFGYRKTLLYDNYTPMNVASSSLLQ